MEYLLFKGEFVEIRIIYMIFLASVASWNKFLSF